LCFVFLALLFILVLTGQTAVVAEEVADKTRALSRQKRFLTMVMDNVPDLISVKDQNMNLVRANSALLEQYPPDKRENVLGDGGYARFSKDDIKIHQKQEQKAMKKGHAEFLLEQTNYKGETRRYLYKNVR